MSQQKPDPEALGAAFPRFPLERMLEGRAPGSFKRGDRPRDHLWASEIGGCARASWTGWHHPRPHDEDFDQHRGALGHAVEDIMARKLAPFLVGREISFYTSLVSGRTDFVLQLGPGEPQIPAECKSTYAFDWSLSAPKRSHVMQLQFYLLNMPEAPYGLLIYYNLANWGGKCGHWDALHVPRDDEGVLSRARHLMGLVVQSEPPECENLDDPRGCWDCSRAEGRLDENGG